MATARSPLRHLDVADVDAKARKESRNREVHLPPVSVYRWWARRTEAVNGAILDAVAQDTPGRLLVADPFAGGGVIPLSAVIRGHRVYAQELDPWAAAGLHAMLTLPAPGLLSQGFQKLEAEVSELLTRAYATSLSDGRPAQIAHTFRVAVAPCTSCEQPQRLFPHAMVSLVRRKERGKPEAYLACPAGHVFLATHTKSVRCPECDEQTDPKADYTRGRNVTCRACRATEKLEDRATHGSWTWEVVLVERATESERELALPTATEIEQADGDMWSPAGELAVIPTGQETAVLQRHGFQRWSDLYPRRQQAVTEALLDAIAAVGLDESVAESMRTAVLGTTEMAGLASRWDRWYLKSYEAMAAHRFNFTTFTAEPNVWGTTTSGRGTLTRRVRLLERASEWLRQNAGQLAVEGPLPAGSGTSALPSEVDVRVVVGSSEGQELPDGVVDLVLTDPPYHDDVQYGELSLPLRAWAQMATERQTGEAVANPATGSNMSYDAYESLLAAIFRESRRSLAEDGHVIFSYANRDPESWIALFRAIQTAGLRACGWAVVHSENETDHSKRNVRACTMDFLLDLVPTEREVKQVWRPLSLPDTPEAVFLRIVAEGFAQVGDAPDGWGDDLAARLRESEFLGG